MVLFESSWEVNNKQGVIYTCISQKIENDNDNDQDYYMIGPLLHDNKGSLEYLQADGDIKRAIDGLSNHGIEVEYGIWVTENGYRAKTILLGMASSKHLLNGWKYDLWKKYNIDFLGQDCDNTVDNSILFGCLVAWFIDIYAYCISNVTLHCHEWQSSIAILNLQNINVKTILTMHSTSLGRRLCYSNPYFYQHIPFYDPRQEAQEKNILCIHDIETYSSKHTSILTAVSPILSKEIEHFLKRVPDVITNNGLAPVKNLDKIKNRDKLVSFSKSYFKDLDIAKTYFIFISGRLEVSNKGYDILLKALKQIKTDITIVCFLITSTSNNLEYTENSKNFIHNQKYSTSLPVSTHTNLHDLGYNHPEYDELLNLMYDIQDNKSDKIKLVHHAMFLNDDNIIGVTYDELISGCDLGVFPSLYEPWGYTPVECLLRKTPAITSNLSGIGSFSIDKNLYGLSILDRGYTNEKEVIANLSNNILENVTKKYDFPSKEPKVLLWEHAYKSYIKARNSNCNKIKIISLERSLDRRQHIKNNLNQLNYIIFNAVDGKMLTEQDNIFIDKYIVRDGDLGRYGNSLSHIHILRDFLNTNNEYQIVFEDDVLYTDKFTNFINDHKVKNLDFDIITFGNFNERCDGEYLGEFSGVNLYYSMYNFVSHGYMITRKGAKKLLENLKNHKLDTFLDRRICDLITQSKFKVITVDPPIVEQVWQVRDGWLNYNLPTLIWTDENKKLLKEIDTYDKKIFNK